MKDALQSLLERYGPTTATEWENALREIVQELALLGLWRSKFYEHAAFYGGTALRIFHGLPRYSENLDFSLLAPDAHFNPGPHLEAVRAELASFGFTFEVDRKTKAVETAIDSAFLESNMRAYRLEIGAPEAFRSRLPRSQSLRIRLEIDTDPPPGAADRVETLLVPIPFQVKLFTLPCLFAGKLHALLCRNWKNRVKGRDFFDFAWYVGRGVPVDLAHLRGRMEQTGHLEAGAEWDGAILRSLLRERFGRVDFDRAREDVLPFVRDPDSLALWGRDFFLELVDRVEVE